MNPNKRRNLISSLLALTLLFLIVIACDGGTSVKGQVRDINGKPIDNANVEFFVESRRYKLESKGIEKTGSNGEFSRGALHSPFGAVKMKLVVSKSGYKTFERAFTSNDAKKNDTFNITLEPSE